MSYEPVIGLEIHAQLLHGVEDLLRLRDRVRRRAQHASVSGLPRPAGRAAGPQSRRRRLRDPRGARARLHDPRDVDLRAQELLLSRSAEGLPDFAVRAAARDRRRGRGEQRLLGAGLRHPHHARPHGRGRRQARCTRASPTPATRSYVDLNRAGTPLIEIVTEPDLRSAADAAAFFAYLRELLVALGVNDGNMEEGSLRCDANVSVRPARTVRVRSARKRRSRTSTRSAFSRRPIEYEIDRQIDVVESGGRVVQETRLWDSAKQADGLDAQQGRGARLPVFSRARPAAARRRAVAARRHAKDELPETPAAVARASEGGARLLGRRRRAADGAPASRRISRRRSTPAPTRRSRGTGCSARSAPR